MIDWTKTKDARDKIARRHEIVELRDLTGITPHQQESDTNFSHRVWILNKDQPWMTLDAVKPFQAGIIFEAELIRESPEYQALVNGTAPDELIARVLGDYYLGRKCSR